MARRKTRTRYRTRVKRYYKKSKGLLGSAKINNLVWGAGAGFISPMIPQFLGGWTNPLVFGAGAILLKKPQLMTIAGYELGKSFSSTGGSSLGGFFE